MLELILYIFAFVFFVVAALPLNKPYTGWIPLGLAFWVFAEKILPHL